MFANLNTMKRIIFSVLALTLLSQESLADSQIISESVLQVNKTHISQGIQNTLNAWSNQPLTLTWARVDLPAPFPAWLEDVKLQIQFQSTEVTTTQNGSAWDFMSPNYSIQLSARNLQAKGEIVKYYGGIRVVIPVEGQCNSLSATYTASNMPLIVKTALQKNDPTQLRLAIKEILFTYNKDNVSTSISSCSGPEGIEEFIDSNVKQTLADQSLWMDRVKQTIENNLSYNFKLEQTLWRNEDLATQVNWLGESWSETSDSFKLKGKVSVYIGRTGQLNSVVEMTMDQQNVSPDATALIIPKNLLSELVTIWSNEGLLAQSFSADQFQAFRELQRNWFSLMFVWPDLLRYSSSTVMSWLVQPLAAPLVSVTSTTGAPTIRMSTWMRADLFALESGAMVPYMNFTVPIGADLQLQVNNNQMSLTVQNLSNVDITAQWDPTFVQRHNPNQHFGKKTIGDQIRKKLIGQTFNFAMPELVPLPWVKLNLQNVNTVGGNMNFTFGLK